MIAAGSLVHRVTLQNPLPPTNVSGEVVTNYSTVGSYWAFVKPVAETETATDPQVASSRTHVVQMRYGAPVTTGSQLLFKGRTLNVLGVVNTDEANEELLVSVKEAT